MSKALDLSMIGEEYRLPTGKEIEQALQSPYGIKPKIVEESNAELLARFTRRAIEIGWSYKDPFHKK